MVAPKPHPSRLKVRVPCFFEAEGEGVLPILIAAGLFVLFLGFVALSSSTAADLFSPRHEAASNKPTARRP